MSQGVVVDIIGFPEGGNLCYQSAMLQAIFSDSAFTSWLNGHHQPPFIFKKHNLRASGCQGRGCKECCTIEDCVLCTLKMILQAYRSRNMADKGSLLRKLMDNFTELLHSSYTDGFGEEHGGIADETGEQQDAIDFLQCLANRIDRQTNLLESTLAPIFGRQDYFETTVCHNPNCAQKNTLQREGNFCLVLHPGEGAQSRDRFCDVPLSSLVDLHWNVEVRDATCDNPTCWASQDRRYGPQRSIRSTEPSVLRSMLCMQLVSFDYHDDDWHRNPWPVSIPGQLDLTDYAHLISAGDRVYNLVAVVSHQGDYGGGHYKAVVKRAGKYWFEANDDDVQYLAGRTAQDRQFEEANGYPPAAEAAWSSDGFLPYFVLYSATEQEGTGTENE